LDAVKIHPSGLCGDINVPPSKSLSHRAVICAGLAEGVSIIDNIVLSEDIIATLEGIKALGAGVEYRGQLWPGIECLAHGQFWQEVKYNEQGPHNSGQRFSVTIEGCQEVTEQDYINKGSTTAGVQNSITEGGTNTVEQNSAIEGGFKTRVQNHAIKGSPETVVQRDATQNHTIDCGESGSTLRFLIPLACLGGGADDLGGTTFTGRGKLIQRPLDVYYEIFDRQRIEYTNTDGGLPLAVKGLLKPDAFKVRGDVSSQFITGLMLALPLLDGDSTIEITTGLQSRGYVELTLDVLKDFGIEVENDDFKKFYIKGNQSYQSADYRVEGDYSQAAFWLVAGLLGGGIRCKGLNPGSVQGDRAIVDVIRQMGGEIRTGPASTVDGANESGQADTGAKPALGFVETVPSVTRGTEIDASQCPDLVPVLAVLGALSRGTTRIINAKRLRIKESDRLRAISTELNKLGADITELEDGLIIEGKEWLKGGMADSWNDHRIAMALAVASVKCKKPVIITGSGAVKKSYPHFWEDFERLGGKIQ